MDQYRWHGAVLGLLLLCGGGRGGAEEAALEPALRVKYFPAYGLDRCGLHRLADKHVLEFCAVSEFAGAGRRRFLITLRDPSRMEKKGAGQAVLVASAVLKAAPDEYLDYRNATIQALAPGSHLIFAPIVRGVPERYRAARAALYVFDEQTRKLQALADPPPCPEGCRGQRVQVSHDEGATEYTIEVIQTVGEEERSTSLTWPARRARE
jgi:hypothetical protein